MSSEAGKNCEGQQNSGNHNNTLEHQSELNAQLPDIDTKPVKKVSLENDNDLPFTIAGLPSHPIIKKKTVVD